MFSAADASERFMGRWSSGVAPLLVRFAGVCDGEMVLDVGAGTGSLTAALVSSTPAGRVVGVDPAAPYIAAARVRHRGPRTCFAAADAQQLPFGRRRIDRTLSLLIFNVIPNPHEALQEMSRVTRPGGTVAAAVWDSGHGMEMLRFFWDEAVALNPAAAGRDERRMPLCGRGELAALWQAHGLRDIMEQAIEIDTPFSSFDDFWSPFLEGQGPAGAYVNTLRPADRDRLRAALRRRLRRSASEAAFVLRARAWAVRGVVPPGT
jgi:SAM-dependent methyltransferase